MMPPTDDSLVAILLCSRLALPKDLGRKSELQPLSANEWAIVTSRLADIDRHPAHLLGWSEIDLVEQLQLDPEVANRIVRLLSRAGIVAIELDRLNSQGIWAVSQRDAGYPHQLLMTGGRKPPPVLFGSGVRRADTDPSVAIVGSRDIDEIGSRFAAALAGRCANEDLVVVSGGARGVDQHAMLAALDGHGRVIGVLSDGLERTTRDRHFRPAILDGRLTLMTPYHPSAGFNAGNAMGRNHIIYRLSTYAVVVASSIERGGTRAGALENLKHGWTPLFVRTGTDTLEGNRDLVRRGGIPLTDERITAPGPFIDFLRSAAAEPPQSDQVGSPEPLEPPAVSDLDARTDGYNAVSDGNLSAVIDLWDAEPTDINEHDILELAWPLMRTILQSPTSEKQLGEALRLERAQVRAWLKRLLDDGRIEKQTRPVRYRVTNLCLNARLPGWEG